MVSPSPPRLVPQLATRTTVIVPTTPVEFRQSILIVRRLLPVPNPRIYLYHEFDRWLDRIILLYRLQPATPSIQVENESKKV